MEPSNWTGPTHPNTPTFGQTAPVAPTKPSLKRTRSVLTGFPSVKRRLLSSSPPLVISEEETVEESEDSQEQLQQLLQDEVSEICRQWLADNASAYFKVEFNSYMKRQERKKTPSKK